MLEPHTTPPPLGLAFVVALVSLALFGAAAVGAGFAFDDLEGVLGNPLINGTRPMLDAFRYDYWHHLGDAGHYRPLAVLSLAIDHRLFGSWAPGYHASSALLHAAVVLFAALFARHLAPARLAWAGLVGAAIFAVHPALADAVAWVSGRSSPLSLLPGVLFGWLLIRQSQPGPRAVFRCVFVAAFLGVLSKEDGFFGAALPLAVAFSRGSLRASRIPAVLGLALAAGLYLALRASALGAALPAAPHAPLAGLPLATRLAAAGGAMATGWHSLLWPTHLAPSFHAATWPTSLTSPTALAGWLVWLGLLATAIATRRTHRALATSLALAALVWLPVQQWIPAGEIFAPRFLYQPLFFLALPLGAAALALAAKLAKFRGGALTAGLLTLLLLLATVPITWRTARTYTSLDAYASATLARFPQDPEAWNTLGLGKEERGDLPAARAAYERATTIDATYGRPHSNLARLDLAAGHINSARKHFEAAVALGPGNPVALCNLGSFELATKNYAAATRAYNKACALAPGLVTAWRGRARLALIASDANIARKALNKAEALDPSASGLAKLRVQLRELERNQSH